MGGVTTCASTLYTPTTLSSDIGDDETSNEQWTDSMASGTLPILYITTEDSVPVLDKETKIPANLWVSIPENCSSKNFEIGSEDNPVEITIKGRGNATWLQDKKPYKIKFESKTEFLGMPKQKHFALLNASGNQGISQVMGMELARKADLGWAPRIEPVELVLNGEYLGLYNVTESIKIDKNRLNIFEQEDLNEDDETIPYGWLVEIDNYYDPAQIIINEPEWTMMRITYHTPEVLSSKQENWLTEEFYKINETIYSSNDSIKETWDTLIDASSLAKLFIVREILGDRDGFNGSFYLYRDKHENAKWNAGPMWDPSLECWQTPTDWLINRLPEYSTWKIIPEIFYTKSFYHAFRMEWQNIYPIVEDMTDFMLDYAEKVSAGSLCDQARWPEVALITVEDTKNKIQWIRNSSKWIDENKNYYEDYLAGFNVVQSERTLEKQEIWTIDGIRIPKVTNKGLYIIRKKYTDGTIETKKKYIH